jgi:hypothetical protein
MGEFKGVAVIVLVTLQVIAFIAVALRLKFSKDPC